MVAPPLALNGPLLRRSGETLANLDDSWGGTSDPFLMKLGSPPKSVTSGGIAPCIPLRLWCRLQGLLFILWFCMCCKIGRNSLLRMDVNLRNKFFYEAFFYYNPLFLVAFMVWLWGINVWVFLHSRVNYTKVFELDHNHLTHREIWMIAFWMTNLALTSMMLYSYFYSYGEVSLAASQPVLLYSILPLIMVFPFDVVYVSSRIFFLRTLLRLSFPLQPVTFADFFVADILTSMAKVLSDLERATCGMIANISWFDADSTCGSHSVWIPSVLAYPYICRFFQCLRQYSDTKDRACLFNAMKYATAFPVIILSALKYHVSIEIWSRVYRPLWLFSSLINSCFSFYWDVTCDWDLSCLSGNCKSKNPLRPSLLYSPTWVYYWAVGSNFLLRCAWTYKLSAHLRHNYITVFLITALEILRRCQWIFFRVENEWNKVITRGNFQISPKEMALDTKVAYVI
eukprot:c21402_g1_i1 orf=216-1580(+)